MRIYDINQNPKNKNGFKIHKKKTDSDSLKIKTCLKFRAGIHKNRDNPLSLAKD